MSTHKRKLFAVRSVRCSVFAIGFAIGFAVFVFSLLALLSGVFLQYLTRRHLFLNRFSQATRPWIWSIRKDVVSLHLQSGYKCSDVFASTMTGQDAESARASLRIAPAG